MYSLHRKKIGIYANSCFFLILFLSQCPDQMVDRRREMMSAALIVSDEPQRHIPSEDLD